MKTFTSKRISSEGLSSDRMCRAFEKSLVLCAVFSLMSVAASVRAAAFFSGTTQGQVNTWASIWTNDTQTIPVAPTAGNTYELVFNGLAFGSSATGGSVNNTRIRNPYGAGAVGDVQIFPGDSLTLNTNTEFRFKNDNIALTSVDFPGVDGNPGLILNGGVLNAGNDFVFTIGGRIQVASTSLICPADNGAGRILELRGFNLAGSLSGTGTLIVCQAGVTVAQEVSSAFNSFSGEWMVKAGWLKGTGVESLGQGNITIDPLTLVPIVTLSVLSNGPAQLELMYDITSSGRLTLRNGGKMILHQDCTFGAATIEGTELTPGTHPYSELVASFPNNFAPDGSGSITVVPPPRVITVNTVNNETPGPDETSLLEALNSLQDGDIVRFDIPGAGPHVIVTPIGGYPFITRDNVTIDGYSQPGASPNTNPILGGNNAALKIVLDSSGTNTAPGSDLPQHRSTRLLFPGFGDTEDAILPVVGAKNFAARGISFISRYAKDEPPDPNVYCVAFVNVNPVTSAAVEASGGHVSGCWFGLHPDGRTFKGGRASVATFRNGETYATGLVIGTDGDGVNDVAEFNIHAAMSLAFHLQVPNVKVSGNYVNVLPDGNTFVDVNEVALAIGQVVNPENPQPQTVEFYENANCTNVIIGTDGDGVSDANERNIVANVHYSETMEFWRAADRVVIAGNYFGVGVDGITQSPFSTNAAGNRQPDFVRLSGVPSSIRIGSNGDGVSDDVEGNLIVNVKGDRFVAPGSGGSGDIAEITVRRNKLINCGFPAVPFADSAAPYANYYPEVVADASQAKPKLVSFADGRLNGSYSAPTASFPNTVLDLYVVDAKSLRSRALAPGLVVQPATWLAAYTDNGTGDLDPDPNEFSFDLSSFGLSASTYVTVLVTYSQEASAQNTGTAVTSPSSNPVAARPSLFIDRVSEGIELWWPAPANTFRAESNSTLFEPAGWFDLGVGTHTDGNNTVSAAFDPFEPTVFFRLISQ